MKILHPMLALLCFMASCADSFAVQNASPCPTGYDVAIVESRHLQRERRFFAYSEHRVRYKIFAKQEGTLKKNYLQEGELYEKGALLLQLKNNAIQMEVLQRRTQLTETRQELEKASLGFRHGQSTGQEVQKAKDRLESAKILYDMAMEEHAALSVTSPFRGRVLSMATKLHAAPEQNLTAIIKGEFLAELVDDAPLILKGLLALPRGDFTMRNSKARIEDNGELIETAILSWRLVGDAEDGSVLEVMLVPPTKNMQHMESGTPVSALLLLPSRFAACAVPREFVLYKGDIRYCLLLRNGNIHEVTIMTGEYDSQYVEVFGEITPGERVLRPAGMS